MRIVLEPVASASTAAAGLWLAQGSRHEAPGENGMTHFAEHLLFKGTRRRHWAEIARAINLFGGHFNACTSSDWVKVYGTVIRRDLPEALDLLAEMFLDSTFPASEVTREREVILEEIAQYEDVPEDLCYEHYTQALLLPHPLGRPVIGTEELVSGFSAGALADYWNRVVTPRRMILSVAGAIDEAAVLEQAKRLFGGLTGGEPGQHGLDPVEGRRRRAMLDRDLEQVNFCLGVTGPKRQQEERFAWGIYDTILGGGMGSRLFDEVRERRGLAYSIGSSVTALHEAGYLTISGSTRPETAATAIEVCLEEVRKLAETGPTAEELATAKQQIERSHLLSLESLGLRTMVNGERELYATGHLTTEEVLARVAAVTPDEVTAIAREVVDFGEPALCLVGPVGKAKGVGGAGK